ncbi:MAG: hypothetical protein ACR5LG_07775 [Sodalis sp. (in: enterobacteria)]|uniref:hypothetical protein n=1 Tax=Sodalis sp. (in: enterobacteria) TaxID=1898979 RepID=UPI003F3D381D
MKSYHLNEMLKGWFVGAFTPSLYITKDVGVAVQHFKAGDYEVKHLHKIATEITVIVSGAVRMNGTKYIAGSIIKILPGESTDFEALEDTVTTVVKLPGILNDKYLVGE